MQNVCVFNPEGNILVTGGDDSILRFKIQYSRIWEYKNKNITKIKELFFHKKSINDIVVF